MEHEPTKLFKMQCFTMQRFQLGDATQLLGADNRLVKRTVGNRYHCSEGLEYVSSTYCGENIAAWMKAAIDKRPEVREYNDYHEIRFSFIPQGHQAVENL